MGPTLDHGWAWLVLTGCSVIYFLLIGYEQCLGLVYLEVLDRFGERASSTAWVTSIAASGRMILAPLGSFLAARYGCRVITIIGGAIMSVGLVLSAFPLSLPYLYFTTGACYGFGSALVFPASLIACNRYFDKRISLASSVGAIGAGLGGIALPPLFVSLLHYYGYTGTMFVMGGLMMNACVAGALYRPQFKSDGYEMKQNKENPSDTQFKNRLIAGNEHSCGSDFPTSTDEANGVNDQFSTRKDGETDMFAAKERTPPIGELEGRTHEGLVDSDSEIKRKMASRLCQSRCMRPDCSIECHLLKSIGFWLYCFHWLFFGFCVIPHHLFLPAIAVDRGATVTQAALLLSIMGIVNVAAKLLPALLFDKPTIRPHRSHIVNSTIFLSALCVILTPISVNYTTLITVCVVYVIAFAVYISQLLSVLVDLVGKDKLGNALGISMLFRSSGVLTGPSLIGLVKDLSQSYDVAFYIGGVLGLLGGICFLLQDLLFPFKKVDAKGSDANISRGRGTKISI